MIKKLRRCLALAVLTITLLVCPPAADALRIRLQHSLGSGSWHGLQKAVDVTTGPGGGYAVAWTGRRFGPRSGVHVRRYDADGTPLGRSLPCRRGAANADTYTPAVATTDSHLFVGCDSVPEEPTTWVATHLRRYTASGAATGDALDLDEALVTELRDIVATGTRVLVHAVVCTSDCEHGFFLFDETDALVHAFTVGSTKVFGVAATSDGGYLLVGVAETRSDGLSVLIAQKHDGDGRLVDGPRRLAVVQLDNNIAPVRVGVDGRIAVSWRILRNGLPIALVHTFAADGTLKRPAVRLRIAGDAAASDIAALPLADGFVLTWTRFDSNDTDLFLQQYSREGDPVGDQLAADERLSSLGDAAFIESADAFLAGGVYDGPGRHNIAVWRIGLENRCGDANGDERVTASDVQAVAQAAAGQTDCTCRCDVDASGVVDAVDVDLTLQMAAGRTTTGDCPTCP